MRRLAAGGAVPLDRMQTNYLCNVLRLAQDASVLVFNGRDGEWLGALDRSAKKSASLVLREQRPRTDGAERSALSVRAAQTCAARLHGAEGGRTRRLAVAAGDHAPYAGQRASISSACARMRSRRPSNAAFSSIPDIVEPAPLRQAARRRSIAERILIFCDERADNADPVAALSALRSARGLRSRC